jgi:type IV pilus assembly protein PilO
LEIRDIPDRLGRLPRSQRLILAGLVYALICVVFYFVLYTPRQDQLTSLRARQTELLTKKAEVERRAHDKEAFEKELEDLTAQLKLALRQLPDDREIPDLLLRISTVARRIGLEVRKFLPKEEMMKEYHAEVPVQLELGGSYHEVAMYFDRLSKLSRIVNVQNIEITDPKERNGKVGLTVTGTLVTFRFLTEDERKKAAEDAATVKKSKRKP